MARVHIPKEFLGAFKIGHRRGVQEYIDETFSLELLKKTLRGDQKAKEALEWITKYNNETYRGVLKKGDPEALHNTDTLYKEASDAHNARRRDLVSVVRSGKIEGAIVNMDEEPEVVEAYLNQDFNPHFEETLIDLVSPKAKGKLEMHLADRSF